LEARAAYAQRQITLEALREIEDRAILDVLEMQRQVGVDILSDGEFRRGAFLSSLAESVEGFVPDTVAIEWHGADSSDAPQGSVAEVVGAPLVWKSRLTTHEVRFLNQHVPGAFKMTVPSPTLFTDVAYKPGLTDQFYPTRSDLLDVLIDIIHNEVRALATEGVRYIQIDAPRYLYYVDPRLREHLRATGVDPDEALDEAIAADNEVLTDVKRLSPLQDELTLALHLCRGNSRSRWFAEGGYDAIAEKLFGSLEVDALLLEYDSDRAGGFEPLRFVRPGTTVVLGLVTTKEPTLEPQDVLRRRIDEASKYVPMENLALSPQCGFASIAAGNLLSSDDQRRKLELVVETAQRVWG
jgi:5-methyltetrahydropteroyltriglutamate--homocysteine methyltransferase